MREIKFRMYDKKTKIMSPINLMEWDKIQQNLSYFKGYHDEHKGEWSVLACNNPKKMTSINVGGEAILTNRYEVMQYTGLKDKNGRKIYEGDIVEERWMNPLAGGEKVDRYKIETSDTTLIVMTHSSGEIQCNRYLWMRHKEVEVIGNIYENPGLLEVRE